MTFSVSYRIADLKWIYRIVSYRDRLIVLYRLRTRLSSLIVSCITEGKYTYINMHVVIYHVIGNYRLQAQTVSYRIVSYRIALAGLSSLSVSRVIADRTYRKVSYRHLSCTYRIVSYRQIQGHDIIYIYIYMA